MHETSRGAEHEALSQLEVIAFLTSHVRLLLSHGCYGAHVGIELIRLRDKIDEIQPLLSLDGGDPVAKSLYYTVRQHPADESHVKLFGPPSPVPDTVPTDWYATWLRQAP